MGQINKYSLEAAGLEYIDRQNVFLFNQDNALKFVSYCEKNEMIILGVEGFYIEKDGITPDLNYIADFSEVAHLKRKEASRRSCQYAKDFLNYSPSTHIYYEFVLN